MEHGKSVSRYLNENLIDKFWPLAILFLLVFIPVSFFVFNDSLSGWFHTADLVIVLITAAYYYRTKDLQLATNVLVFMGIPILLPWLISGGPFGTGLWWSLIYVAWAFFLTDKKSAMLWLCAYGIVCAVVTLMAPIGLFETRYSIFELLNILFAFVFLTVLIYFFSNATEYYLNLSKEELNERRKAEEKFRILLESTPDALLIADTTGNINLVNHKSEQLFGYSKNELVGKNVNTLVPGGLVSKALTQNDLTGKRKDGTEFPVDVTISPLKSEGLILGAVRDITDKIEQEERMRKYSILEAKSKEMEQFTYIASHDLRHPLLTILNYIKILDNEYASKLDEDGKMFVQLISESADRMDKLVLGLLDYSRLSKIKELEIVKCNDLVNEVLADLSSAIEESKAQITVESLPEILGYPLELRQLFQNLIANAIKFKKQNTPPVIQIRAQQDGGSYVFEVTDNGIGIAAKDLEKIFQIFQRLHSVDEYEGLGLGLAYCKKIVELHNGHIWVTSTPEIGSYFYFSIKTR